MDLEKAERGQEGLTHSRAEWAEATAQAWGSGAAVILQTRGLDLRQEEGATPGIARCAEGGF